MNHAIKMENCSISTCTKNSRVIHNRLQRLLLPKIALKVDAACFIKDKAFVFKQLLLKFIAMFVLEGNATLAIYYSMPGQVLFGRR